jgi:hypothetical protein
MSRQATLHVHRFAPLAMALALVGCATASGRPPPAPGRIEGVIQHPAHVVPAMRICALSTAPSREPHRCTQTRAAQGTYRIDGLPPGDYQVFAETEKGIYRTGGHLQPVQCIRAPCPDQPRTLTVASGATLDGIDLTFFDDDAGIELPPLPPD